MALNLLWDLDGTLTDPKEGITRSITFALETLGVPAPPLHELHGCIGPSLLESFAKLLVSHPKTSPQQALDIYRERYARVGLFENEAYLGIAECLRGLSAEGYRHFVATAKPTVFAVPILERFRLAHHFEGIHGAELDGTRSDKAELIAFILQKYSLNARQTLMIGDREHDMRAAWKNSVGALGVTYGYGSRAELISAGADLIAESPAGLLPQIRELNRKRGESPAAPKKTRNELIDLLRGIAILLVLTLHFHLSYRLDQGFFALFLPAVWIRKFAANGNYGVTIFFVLSGFLITSTSITRFGQLHLVKARSFYRFRFARIFPNILLMLALVLGLGGAGMRIFQNDPSSVSMFGTVLSVLTFTHNLFMEKFGYFNYCLNILWSLSVEEVFYLFFPLFCLTLKRERLLATGWVLLALISPLYRYFHRESEIIALYNSISCFDAIAIGCLVALLKPRIHPSALTARWLSGLAAAVMVTVYLKQGIMSNVVIGISLMALSTGLILLMAKDGGASPFKKPLWAGFRWLGKNSYELYLFHILVLALMRVAVKRDALPFFAKPFWFLLFLALSSAAAELVARFFSEPLNLRLRGLARSQRLGGGG